MICNVCGEDDRCYVLVESDLSNPILKLTGMIFAICTKCLTKLIANIVTNKTVLDDPNKEVSLRERRLNLAQLKLKESKNG